MPATKWDTMDDDDGFEAYRQLPPNEKEVSSTSNLSSSSDDVDEETRKRLRQVEVQVLQYADRLEASGASRDHIEKEVAAFRKRLQGRDTVSAFSCTS
jgi:hypothetical protein